MKPRARVIVFPGSNGDRDLLETFVRAGFDAGLCRAQDPLPECEVAALPGGFSYGDYWRAGMLASQSPAVLDLPKHVERGGLVIGICNGFQILVEAGLLPGALASNNPPGFRHRWIDITVAADCKSPWLADLEAGARLHLPMAHGEGNYFHPDGAAALTGKVACRYDKNPNGSLADTAALVDSTGRVLGIMPHPERAADPNLGTSDGLPLFTAAYRHAQGRAGARS